MKLFHVFMRLDVTLRGPNGKERKVETSRRLAIIAESEEHAEARARGWLQHEHRDPRRLEIEFSQGKSRAIAVAVVEPTEHKPAMLIGEQPEGAMKL